MNEPIETKVKHTEQTSAGLCSALFEEFDLLRNNLSDASRASAVAKLAVQIINVKRLEIDAAAFHKAGLRFVPLALTAKGLPIGEQDNAD
jgi:hypothetical protein